MPNKKMPALCPLLLCFWVIAPVTSPASADTSELSEAHTAIVDTSQPGKAGKSFSAATIIAAPVAKICAILQEYSAYPGFMPNVHAVQVTPAADHTAVLDMTLTLPLGKIKKYRLKMTPKAGPDACQLSWKLVPWEGLKPDETIVETSGYWQLTPKPSDRKKTVVRYVVHTDPGPVPMGLGWIVDSMSKDSIPKTMQALRDKAAQ